MISPEALEQLTREYGGEWGRCHSLRLLSLIAEIGQGLDYDRETIWLAAYLHDWGAYSRWAQDGVDHPIRSRQVAEEFLREQSVPEERITPVLECIEFHHSGRSDRSLEAILLSDADALDFLGVTGVLRDFAKNPRELRRAFETSLGRMKGLQEVIILERSKAIMQIRLDRMARLFADFEAETGGLF